MEITLYEGKKINSVGQTYEKEIKDTLAPIIQKSYKNKIKRSDFLRLLISIALSYRTPLEFNKVILKQRQKEKSEIK